MSEDIVVEDSSIKDEPSKGNLVFYLIPGSARSEAQQSEDFRVYPVTILFKFTEQNIALAQKIKYRVFDTIRDIFWARYSGTYFYICEQEGGDNHTPAISQKVIQDDGNLISGGNLLVHRGSQTWNFHKVTDHPIVNLSEVKTGTAQLGERI